MEKDTISLLSLPDELIVKILGYCGEDERKALCFVDRRFRQLYRNHVGVKFVFHLQGHSMRLFELGLDYMFRLQTVPFRILKISGFNLKEAFGQWKLSENSILGRPVQHHLDNSVCCERILSIEIHDCLVTDESLIWLRRLFPNYTALTIFRSSFTRASDRLAKLEDYNVPKQPLRVLKISLPLITDCNPSATGWNESKGEFTSWLMNDYCKRAKKVLLFKSKISANRATKRKFYQMNNGSQWKAKAEENVFDYTSEDLKAQLVALGDPYDELKDFTIRQRPNAPAGEQLP